MSRQKPSFARILGRTSRNFLAMLPLIVGIIGLVGLFQQLVSPEKLATLFRGNVFSDTFIGTCIGSVAAGNPVVSYILGGGLLQQGVSLYAVSAFILSWVTMGVVQLPAEIECFGGRFTLYRNILAFIFTLLVAVFTTFTVQVLQ
jgi:uncharacterized membrane protein YraQ (UPF0718 family)